MRACPRQPGCATVRRARSPAGPGLLRPLALAALLATTAPAWGDTPIRSAALAPLDGGGRLILESPEEFRFTLFILRYPNRLVLEIENATDTRVLQSLAGQLPPDHPSIKAVRVRAAPGKPRAVHIELELKGETYPAVRTLKPSDGHGHRLVLAVSPGAADASAFATAPAPAVAPPAPAPEPPAARAPEPPPAQVAAPPAPATESARTAPPAATPPAVAEVARPPATPATPPPGEAQAGPAGAEDPLLLEVALDQHVLADSVNAYQDGRRVFLPLGQLAEILTLAIRTQPAQGTAEGFVLDETRAFRLNVSQARLALGEETQAFDPALVRVRGDDIYVESGLLSRWLPVDLNVDFSRLRLRVRPRETLPLQARLQRERAGERLGARTGERVDPGYPRQETPYRLLGMPFIDQTFGLGLRTGRGGTQHDASYTGYLTGDFLGMESSLFVQRSRERHDDVRFTLGRHDPEAGLLGPLRARSVLFGSGVGIPFIPHVAFSTPPGDGYGFTLSNRPLDQPANFDRHTLEGDLPPGWDVELYYNDALIGFQRSRPDGRYRFEDLPLSYGPNEFRLVFHGPLGQQRVERQRFLLDQSATPAGELRYNATQHRSDSGALRSVGQVDWGLSDKLTASLGWVRLPRENGSLLAASQYNKLGLRAFWNGVIASTDIIRSDQGGWLSDSALKTRIGTVAIDYNHLHLKDFASEVFPLSGDPLRMRDKVRLQSSLPLMAGLPRLPVTLEVQRDQHASGSSSLLAGGRVSAHVRNTSLTNELVWRDPGREAPSLLGALSVSHRLGDIGLAGQLGYSLQPGTRLDTIAVTGEKRFGESYLASVGVARAFTSGETIYSASLNKSQGSYGLGLNATWSRNGGLALGLQLFIAMGQEPREGRWMLDALPKADSGAASVRVFLDRNGNGVADSGEEPVANAGLVVNGSRQPARTNEAGVAWLDRLPTRVPLDIGLDVQTLEDPFWQPLRKGVRVVARPGRVATVDFPVVQTSEIEGTVYLQEGAAKRALGNVGIELVDAAGTVVASGKSGSDGYYVLTGATQGTYTVRAAPQQLEQLGLPPVAPRQVSVGPTGEVLGGFDFVLVRGGERR